MNDLSNMPNNVEELELEQIKRLIDEAKSGMSDIRHALYYIKLVGRAGKINQLRPYLHESGTLELMDKILEAYDFQRILIVNVLCT